MAVFSDSAAAAGANYSGSYPADAGEITIPFEPKAITFSNEDVALSAVVSFQGKDWAGANDDQVFLAAGEVKRLDDFSSPGTYDGKGQFSGVQVFIRAAAGAPIVALTAEA